MNSAADLRTAAVPRHVAIVMDGNGRWARKRFMPRFFGHKQGVDALVRAVQACADRGIEYLTVFAFSSENWKRPSEEVSGLMGLVLVAVSKYLTKLAGEGVRIRIVGDRSAVSDKLRAAWDAGRAHHARTTRASRCRWPSTTAAAGTSCRPAGGRSRPGLAPEQIDEALAVGATWRCATRPTPTCSSAPAARCASATSCSGRRPTPSSYFTDCLWPDFGEAELDAALAAYAQRDRRFGDVPSRRGRSAR